MAAKRSCRRCRFWAYTGKTGDCLATTTKHGENMAHLVIYSRNTESSMWLERPPDNLTLPAIRTDPDFHCSHFDDLGYDLIERMDGRDGE